MSIQTIYNVLSLCSSKNIVVFLRASTSHEYCNLYCVYDKLNIKNRCVWIDSGKYSSLSALWILAHAKIVLLDQSSRILSNIILSKDTIVIQLWHGGGLYKKVGFDAFRMGYDHKSEYKRVQRIHGQIDYFVISDSKLIQYYANTFKLGHEQIMPLGLARTDLLYQCDKGQVKSRFYELHPEAKGEKLLLYAPTFRKTPGARNCSHNEIDIDFLNTKLGQEWCFLFRIHPTLIGKVSTGNGWIDISRYGYKESILLADALVTDYSSILFDFSITGNPVFLYIPDIAEYMATERMLYVNPENLVSEKTLPTIIMNLYPLY